MYIKDGIVYAGEQTQPLKISGVRPLDDYVLWLRFTNGEARTFDCKELLKYEVYQPLLEKEMFNGVYIDYGVVVWDDGNIDIDPEYLYRNSVAAGGRNYA